MTDQEIVMALIKKEPDFEDLGQMLGLLPYSNKSDKVRRVRGTKTWCIKHQMAKREEHDRWRCKECRREEVQRREERKKACKSI